jgi:hypothetical protein
MPLLLAFYFFHARIARSFWGASACAGETLAGFFIHSSRLNFVHYCFPFGQAPYRLAVSFANRLGVVTGTGAVEFSDAQAPLERWMRYAEEDEPRREEGR